MERTARVIKVEENLIRDSRLYKSLMGSLRYVEKFCRRYRTHLTAITTTLENTQRNPREEPALEFSDNLGLYTLQGIRNSL